MTHSQEIRIIDVFTETLAGERVLLRGHAVSTLVGQLTLPSFAQEAAA